MAPERSALKAMQKKRWEKAENVLRKSIRKDSINALARYYMSSYFFKPGNPSFSLDSAYLYITQSLEDYEKASARERDRMQRFAIDSSSLISFRAAIDSAAFEQARMENTEEAYIMFLEKHPFAAQQKQAMDLRDEMAYLNALKTNTYEGFLHFLKKYPLAVRAGEARQKYELLLYEARTRDRRLQSYENFLNEHPETPYRKEIEQNIFELFTLSGKVERYLAFIETYPASDQVKRAYDILFHILREKENLEWPGLFLSDSLQNIHRLQQNYLVPFLKGEKFGFIDKTGKEIIPPMIDHLNEEYRCGNVTEDIIVLSDRILARDHSIVYRGAVEEVDDLGSGFLKLKSGNCYIVIHKSGFIIERCAQDAKVADNRFVTLLKEGQWSIYAFTGRKIIPEVWQEITTHENIIALKKDDLWHLFTPDQLLQMADQQKIFPGRAVDEIKILPKGLILAKSGKKQAVLGQTLEEIIPFEIQEITPTFFGFVGKSADGFHIYNTSGKQVGFAEDIVMNDPWLAVINRDSSYLFDPAKSVYLSRGYDSLKFEGPFALGIKGDTTDVYFTDQRHLQFVQPIKAQFIPGKDSTSFLCVETSEILISRNRRKTTLQRKTLYSRTGNKLFTGEYDQLHHAGQNLFIVHRKEKKGIVDITGKIVLPVVYDAIGSITGNVISLLGAMKFGLYDVELRKLIKPQYDKNLIPYNTRLVAAFRNGRYSFIDWSNKSDNPETFEEIRYWNDTVALVRNDQRWMLYDVNAGSSLLNNVKQFNMIKDQPDEKLAIFQQGNAFGVLSNKKGTVIPITFSDVVNVGSAEEPLYFTEKHVEEASIFVVIYYDKNGKLLRREVYREAEDYEKIYCHD